MPGAGTGNRPAAGVPRRAESANVDVIIVVLFAVLGFIGAVILYFLNTAPIITSIFLATGVASLVYRFLGGIQGATFTWGALKLGGSMAALVGIAFGVNYYLQEQTRIPAAGQYEWQWAGDGWLGYVNLASDGTAEIEMKRFLTCNGQLTEKPLLHMNGKGKVSGNVNGTKLDVSFPVTFLNYDTNCNGADLPYSTVISGTLERTPAYAGRISYVNKYASSTGDMILVKHYSH